MVYYTNITPNQDKNNDLFISVSTIQFNELDMKSETIRPPPPSFKTRRRYLLKFV